MLLALLTICSVGGALFMQYRTINAEVEALERRTAAIAQIRLTSRVIHALQKERGLSAGFLVNMGAGRLKKLGHQRQQTNDLLATFDSQGQFSLLTSDWLVAFRDDLSVLREQVDTETTDWHATRAFYTDAITHALDAIIRKNLEGEQVEQGRTIMAIASLALARENLGLIRAAVSRVYSQDEPVNDDIKDVIRYYGAFTEHQRAFTRDLKGPDRDVLLQQMFSDVYEATIHRIEAILGFVDDHSDHHPTSIWWEEATLVIDTMKAVEDNLFDDLSAQITLRMEGKRTELGNYVLIALALTAMVFLLTVLTMLRMLKAMGVLLRTLGRVMSDQDFKARIPPGSSSDEFQEISISINDLLSYTDTLIKEKDFLANTDLLTGVLNRRSFLEGVQREFDRARRYGGTLGLAVCDIDRFKTVNDTYGHETGDAVLKQFSVLLQGQMRKSDLFGRWGGEEFVVMVPQTEADELRALAEKLQACVQAADFPEAGSITCSIGAAKMRSEDTFDSLFKRADEALYRAKSEGRNRVEMAE